MFSTTLAQVTCVIVCLIQRILIYSPILGSVAICLCLDGTLYLYSVAVYFARLIAQPRLIFQAIIMAGLVQKSSEYFLYLMFDIQPVSIDHFAFAPILVTLLVQDLSTHLLDNPFPTFTAGAVPELPPLPAWSLPIEEYPAQYFPMQYDPNAYYPVYYNGIPPYQSTFYQSPESKEAVRQWLFDREVERENKEIAAREAKSASQYGLYLETQLLLAIVVEREERQRCKRDGEEYCRRPVNYADYELPEDDGCYYPWYPGVDFDLLARLRNQVGGRYPYGTSIAYRSSRNPANDLAPFPRDIKVPISEPAVIPIVGISIPEAPLVSYVPVVEVAPIVKPAAPICHNFFVPGAWQPEFATAPPALPASVAPVAPVAPVLAVEPSFVCDIALESSEDVAEPMDIDEPWWISTVPIDRDAELRLEQDLREDMEIDIGLELDCELTLIEKDKAVMDIDADVPVTMAAYNVSAYADVPVAPPVVCNVSAFAPATALVSAMDVDADVPAPASAACNVSAFAPTAAFGLNAMSTSKSIQTSVFLGGPVVPTVSLTTVAPVSTVNIAPAPVTMVPASGLSNTFSATLASTPGFPLPGKKFKSSTPDAPPVTYQPSPLAFSAPVHTAAPPVVALAPVNSAQTAHLGSAPSATVPITLGLVNNSSVASTPAPAPRSFFGAAGPAKLNIPTLTAPVAGAPSLFGAAGAAIAAQAATVGYATVPRAANGLPIWPGRTRPTPAATPPVSATVTDLFGNAGAAYRPAATPSAPIVTPAPAATVTPTTSTASPAAPTSLFGSAGAAYRPTATTASTSAIPVSTVPRAANGLPMWPGAPKPEQPPSAAEIQAAAHDRGPVDEFGVPANPPPFVMDPVVPPEPVRTVVLKGRPRK